MEYVIELHYTQFAGSGSERIYIDLTNSKDLSPSRETANCTATQRIPSHLWNAIVHYQDYKSPSMVPIPNQTNSVLTTQDYLSKVHFNIILAPTSSSSYFPTNNLYAFLFTPTRASCVEINIWKWNENKIGRMKIRRPPYPITPMRK
jgi:hypothetical protein